MVCCCFTFFCSHFAAVLCWFTVQNFCVHTVLRKFYQSIPFVISNTRTNVAQCFTIMIRFYPERVFLQMVLGQLYNKQQCFICCFSQKLHLDVCHMTECHLFRFLACYTKTRSLLFLMALLFHLYSFQG